MFHCFCLQRSFPAGITTKSLFPRSRNRFATPQRGDGGGPANGERKRGAKSRGRTQEGQDGPSCRGLSRNGRAESGNPAATATRDFSFPPPSRTRGDCPRCLVTACSEGVTAENVPLTTSSEISGPSSVLYVCPNITATRCDIRTLKTLLNHILCTIARYVRQ